MKKCCFRGMVGSLAVLAGALVAVGAVDELKAPEPPPFSHAKPSPSNVASSEGSAPLPGPPVTKQKRQEKKNPPQPPVLISKIRTNDAEDWARTPDDLRGLLEWMSTSMNVHFSSNLKRYAEVSSNPAKNPVIYRSGYKPFQLTPSELKVLRDYVLNGGTIIFNPLVGNPEFYKSALQAARQLVPERPVYQLRLDHPVFHAFYNIDKVKYRERMEKDGLAEPYPHLEGVDIDNRTAIFISKWDFACGWESNPADSWGYCDSDARRIGGNIISYVTAMQEAGHSVGKSVELVNADKKTASKFRVGQVIHNGVWKTRAASFPMLLNEFNVTTSTPVSFELKELSLEDPLIFEYPFLYLTGTTDFSFNPKERANLLRFLLKGGTLFAEAGEGRSSFDQAFRKEMGEILDNRQLVSLPPDHRLFREPIGLNSMKARPQLAARHENQTQLPPELMGIYVRDSLAVIYSPNDLSTGWERAAAPYCAGYEAPDASSLGINILFSAVAR